MYFEDESHRDWEMSPKTQRRFSLGVAIVAVVVVLLNLLGTPGPSMWNHEQPSSQNIASK